MCFVGLLEEGSPVEPQVCAFGFRVSAWGFKFYNRISGLRGAGEWGGAAGQAPCLASLPVDPKT